MYTYSIRILNTEIGTCIEYPSVLTESPFQAASGILRRMSRISPEEFGEGCNLDIIIKRRNEEG